MTIIRRTNPLGELIALRRAMDRPSPARGKPRHVRITPNPAVADGGAKGTSSQSVGGSGTVEHQASVERDA